jgi:hypothetical protein
MAGFGSTYAHHLAELGLVKLSPDDRSSGTATITPVGWIILEYSRVKDTRTDEEIEHDHEEAWFDEEYD